MKRGSARRLRRREEEGDGVRRRWREEEGEKEMEGMDLGVEGEWEEREWEEGGTKEKAIDIVSSVIRFWLFSDLRGCARLRGFELS